MHAIYAFGLLILIAFLGSRFIFRRRVLSPLAFLFLSGLIYIFLGLSLGKKGFNIMSSQVLEGLNPLISLGLGWIGFLFGFQLEYRYLRKFPRKYISLSFLQSLFVILLVSGALYVALKSIFAAYSSFLLSGMAVAFGLLVSLNSPTLLNAASFMIPKRGNYYHLSRFLVSISGFWGIVGLALVYSFWHYPFFESKVFETGLVFLLISTVFPILLGCMFHLLTQKKVSEHELLVYILGLVFFVSGAAFYFNLPSLYVSMVMGMTYSNLSRIHEKIYPLLLSTEKPLYITFLVLIGALWDFGLDYKLALLVASLLMMRIIGYVIPLPTFKRLLRFPFALPTLFGLSFFSSGGIGIAFAVSLKLAYRHPLADVFLSVALATIIISELLSPWALKVSLFRLDAEEIV